jgi:hypothetical protein
MQQREKLFFSVGIGVGGGGGGGARLGFGALLGVGGGVVSGCIARLVLLQLSFVQLQKMVFVVIIIVIVGVMMCAGVCCVHVLHVLCFVVRADCEER